MRDSTLEVCEEASGCVVQRQSLVRSLTSVVLLSGGLFCDKLQRTVQRAYLTQRPVPSQVRRCPNVTLLSISCPTSYDAV